MSADDSWSFGQLRRRLRDFGPAQADVVGRASQTAHQARSLEDHDSAEEMWEIAREAARMAEPRLQRLRFVTITTDSPGSFAAWVQSLRRALDDAGWRLGRGPQVEVLRVANDADPSVDAEHREAAAGGIAIRVAPIEVERRPLPLAAARRFAFRCLRELDWIPSPRQPVWSLDEDFRFESFAPSPRKMFVRRSGGPLLHRLDALVAQLSAEGVSAIIGGNTGAAPVPALGLVRGQVHDLIATPDAGSDELRTAALARFSSLDDGYYDLAEVRSPDLCVPLMRGWWREDGAVEWSEIVSRLQAGLPVTRPALAPPLSSPSDAWAHHVDVSVAGGNTVLLSPHALGAHFSYAKCGDLVSRRADTTWCIAVRQCGAKVVRASLPLFHDRQMRPRSPAAAAQEAVTDALGVGVYRAMLAGVAGDKMAVTGLANARLASLVACLNEAAVAARSLSARRGAFAELADWIDASRQGLSLPAATLRFYEESP